MSDKLNIYLNDNYQVRQSSGPPTWKQRYMRALYEAWDGVPELAAQLTELLGWCVVVSGILVMIVIALRVLFIAARHVFNLP